MVNRIHANKTKNTNWWKLHTLFKSKNEMFLYWIKLVCVQCVLLLFFLLRLPAPFFMVAISLYSSLLLHFSPPTVDFLGNPLDVCPIRTSWKLCEEIWVGMTLFKCHFSINAVSSFRAVHLMWWWQPSSQIFPLLLLA